MSAFLNKHRSYIIALTLVALCFIFNSGCALLFATHKTTIVTGQDSTVVDVSTGYSSIGIRTINADNSANSAMVPGRTKTIHVSNQTDSYAVTQSKPGYLPYTMPIARYKFNPGKGIDLGIHFIGSIILIDFLTSSLSANNTPSGYPAAGYTPPFPPIVSGSSVYFGGWGWLDLFLGPWKIYPKATLMPALVKIPYRTNDENKLYVKNVGVDIGKNSLKETYYKTFGKYYNHTPTLTRSEEDAIRHKNTQFADTLNRILSDWNYQDTNHGFFSHVYNGDYYLKCDVTSFSIMGVDRYMFVDFKCNWKIYGTTSDNEIYSYTTDCPSSWTYFSEGDFEFDEFATDVLQRSMAQFLSTEQVQKCLHDKDASANVIKKWNTIPITASSKDSVKNLDDAINAVVTVVVTEGHGSGCIISPDGYLITNHHVVTEDTSSKVKILFSNGDSTTATVLRSNAEFDLAILKIDKPGPYKYFPVDTVTHDVPIGDDVFAIGTPESIFLGQTLTKGIISGERNAGGRTLIQTDVSINPGNSGGALVSSTGHLLGIVNAKMKGVGIQGIGFAIPSSYIDDALKVQFNKN